MVMRRQVVYRQASDHRVAEMIRVNQAGEYGAKRIYEGQLAYLKNKDDIKLVQHMYEQELEHLKYFNNELIARKIRPTAMQPIWHVAGFALGAISAMMGAKMAMACTVAVEEVIEEHYQDQQDALKHNYKEADLATAIQKFQAEENEHKHHGMEYDGDFKSEIFKSVVRFATKAAICISKKI